MGPLDTPAEPALRDTKDPQGTRDLRDSKVTWDPKALKGPRERAGQVQQDLLDLQETRDLEARTGSDTQDLRGCRGRPVLRAFPVNGAPQVYRECVICPCVTKPTT